MRARLLSSSRWSLTSLLTVSAAALPSQHPLTNTGTPDLSAELFRSVHGLLKSWSQAFDPNGRSVIPGIIPTGTLLYHGRGDASPPTSGLEWFALDPEHAYMFASRGPNSSFNTYIATKPLEVLYLDGFSASKGDPGSQDLQDLLSFGKEELPPGFRDALIAKRLCSWAGQHGVGGFVREEATFEVIWCDFSRDVRLVATVNTTRTDREDRRRPPEQPPHPYNPAGSLNSIDPTGRGPPEYSSYPQVVGVSEESSKLTGRPVSIHQWQMLVAASSHYYNRDSRVQLAVSYMTTLTDIQYESLHNIYKLPSSARRLKDISFADLSHFKEHLASNVNLWLEERHKREGVDFLSMTDAIVDRVATRLARMQTYLRRDNATEAIQAARTEINGLLLPYLDVPHTTWEGSHKPDARTRHLGVAKAIKACSTAYTSFIGHAQLTHSDKLLIGAIEGTLHRICDFSGRVLQDALSMDLRHLSPAQTLDHEAHLAKSWSDRLDKLMQWLDWPAWKNCRKGCEVDEICYVPMWPIFAGPGRPAAGPTSIMKSNLPLPTCVKIGVDHDSW